MCEKVNDSGIKSRNFDIVSDILDEIALEGLDGITIPTLFGRLSCRENFCLAIDDHSRKYIWNIVARLNPINFFVLPTERNDITVVSFDLFEEKDRVDLAVKESEAYPLSPIAETGDAGSCAHYATRKDVTSQVRKKSLQQVETEWGSRLVVVATFNRRFKALSLDSKCSPDPNEILAVTPMDYIYLEMIGRSRERGLSSTGPGSVMAISKDSRTVFYHVSHLVKHGLVQKYVSRAGYILRLTRFAHVKLLEEDSHQLLEQLVSELKKRPNFCMATSEISQVIPSLTRKRFKRMCDTEAARRCLARAPIPYQSLYPNATEEECLTKTNKEKLIHSVKLINQDIKQVEVVDDDQDEDITDNSDKDLMPAVPLSFQLYREVLVAGAEGIGQKQLREKVNTTRAQVIYNLKRLLKNKIITCRRVQFGRQQTLMYTLSPDELKKPAVRSLQKRLAHTSTTPIVPGTSTEENKVLVEVEEALPSSQNIESSRKLVRMGLIMRAIKAKRFMQRLEIFYFVLKEEEARGYKDKMDRRSLKRILDKLVEDNIIKTINKDGQDYYTDPAFNPDELEPANEVAEPMLDEESYLRTIVMDSDAVMSKIIAEDQPYRKEISQMRNTKHSSPKFLRLSILHDLLYYLVHGYAGDTSRSQAEMLACLEAKLPLNEETRNDLPRLYIDHPSCYMFIPPLSPSHEKVPGWCTLIEVLLNAPMSVFSKILKVTECGAELEEYENHPLRSHYTIKMLPSNLRAILLSTTTLQKVFMDVRRLCFMGLARLGKKSITGKNYLFPIYLNSRASILDTTTSPPGYLEVDRSLHYDTINYFFRSPADVKAYWINLFNICLETKLGTGKLAAKGLTMAREFNKDILLPILNPVTPAEAVGADIGSIPGDHLGAGGLDSSMFSFMRSNWVNNKASKANKSEVNVPRKISLKSRKKRIGKQRLKKRAFKKKWALDETDLEAMKKMSTLRAQWSEVEDCVLILVKAAADLLTPSGRSCVRISGSDMRAALRRHAGPACLDKTQSAIQRRIVYLGRIRKLTPAKALVQVLRNLPEAQCFLSPHPLHQLANLKPTSPNLKEIIAKLSTSYHQLVDFMVDRYLCNGVILATQEMEIPDTMLELRRIYDLTEKPSVKLTLRRIQEASIRAVILSSLATVSDKTSQALQLYEVYRQYDERLLRASIERLHRQGTITFRKRTDNKHGRPSTHSPYMFSQRFAYLLNTKYPQTVYHEAYLELNKLLCCEVGNSIEMNLVTCGPAVFALAGLGHVTMTTSVPEEFIALDTECIPAATSAKIFKRYAELLKNSDPAMAVKQVKARRKRPLSSDSELDEEEEPAQKRKVLDLEERNSPEAKAEQGLPMDVEDFTDELTQSSSTTCEISVADSAEKITVLHGVRSARVALLYLREIAASEIDPDRALPHRKPIDIFLVSASKVYCTSTSALARDYGVCDSRNAKKVLQKIVERSELSENKVTMTELLNTCSENEREHLKLMADWLTSRGTKGATLREARAMCTGAANAVHKLESAGLVLRLGVDEQRLIFHEYAAAWAVKSFKLTRLMRDRIKPSDTSVADITKTAKKPQQEDQNEDRRTSTRDDPKPVNVVMRPWVRVDGSVNRRVLDRLLGTTLGYIMLHPGRSEAGLAAVMAPTFAPVWTRELVQILADIGCVVRRFLYYEKPNLFSSTVIHISDELDGLESEQEVLVEPKPDAIIKLGQFIGNKSYCKDYLGE